MIAARYRLDVRLGRDGDIVEWLGTDTTLDRPVLVRKLGPDTSSSRRTDFVAAVRAAAGVHHTHLLQIYAVDATATEAFSIEEWAGGVTVADRHGAGEVIPAAEFLPNAAGLAEALAECHRAGVQHGAIDTRAVYFASAHPAKLGGYGRAQSAGSPDGDTAALAEVLIRAATGRDDTDLGPSQLNDGLPVSTDTVLLDARAGRIDADELARRLRGTTATTGSDRFTWSWRWALVAAILVGLALAVGGLGLLLRVSPSSSPALFPGGPVATATTVPSTTTTTRPAGDVRVVFDVAVYDPFGNEIEEDGLLDLLRDDDPRTAWHTERYFDELPSVKPGVGVVFTVRTSPDFIDMSVSPGTHYSLGWAPVVPDEFTGWEFTATGRIVGGSARVQLPSRRPGAWLLWLTDLPRLDDDVFGARIFEVRFTS